MFAGSALADRAAIADRVKAAAGLALVAAVCAAGEPSVAVAAAGRATTAPCVAAGMLAIVAPGTAAPQVVGPALTAFDRQSVTSDGYADTTAGSGLTVTHVVIGAAGCTDTAGTPGGTSTRATAWSALGGVVGGSALQVDLVPAGAAGRDLAGGGWRLRPSLDGLLVGGKPATLDKGETVALGTWGVLDRPETIDAGAGAPLRWWKAALEVRVLHAHAGFAAGTRLLFGWVSADRAPAAPPVTPPSTTTTARTTTEPAATTTTATTTTTTTTPNRAATKKGPATKKTPQTKRAARKAAKRAAAKRAAARKAAVKKKARVERLRQLQRRAARVGQPLHVTPSLGTGTYDFPVLATASWGDTYGAGRSDVPGGWHHGDDLFVPLGTPVVAVTDGIVFSVGWNAIGGWRVWLEDAQGNDFYYAHLSGYTKLAQNNHHVRRGQVLGFVGNTGDAFTTIPHLHFEVHPFGLLSLGYDGAVDPTRYLASWPRPGGTDVLPPVPLPSPNFRGSGSLTDFRRLLALRPLAKPPAPPAASTPPRRASQTQILASRTNASKSSDGWAPAASGALLLILAATAVWLTAREGRSD